ncbi:MAG: hypothetical protein H0X37_05815 [Herpetosiphonaceae bacterium]|nr:hypothetical protein [Herpetosiphonaceae bacterium]
MESRVWAGVVAGAAGTVALNIATYADMALRGRPASEVPDKLAGALADQAGVDLRGSGPDAEKTASNRRTGIGSLMGYGTGLGVGIAYGLVRPQIDDLPPVIASVVVGLAAMATSDLPATLSGATDPATWGASGWLSDVGFHLVYGFATVMTYDALVDN